MAHDIDALIDDIDRLVDEQLAAGPVDDYSVNRYDRCWRCGRDWHGMAITTRMEAMRHRQSYDEAYRVADDDSPILCPGSDFIGPAPAPAPTPMTPNTTPGFRVSGRFTGQRMGFVADHLVSARPIFLFSTDVRDRTGMTMDSFRRALDRLLTEIDADVEFYSTWSEELPTETLEIPGRRSITVLADDQLHRRGRRERSHLEARVQQQSIAAADRRALLDRYRTRMQEMTQ